MQGFCPIKIEITQFPDGFHLKNTHKSHQFTTSLLFAAGHLFRLYTWCWSLSLLFFQLLKCNLTPYKMNPPVRQTVEVSSQLVSVSLKESWLLLTLFLIMWLISNHLKKLCIRCRMSCKMEQRKEAKVRGGETSQRLCSIQAQWSKMHDH